jgi:hypothetical protein
MGLWFTFAAALASAVILRSEFRRTHDHILSQIRDSTNLEGQAPVFIYPRNRVTQLYPQALGSLFVACYILAGLRWRYSTPPQHGADHTENIPVSTITVLLCASHFRGNVFTKPLRRNGLRNTVVLLLRACMLRALPVNSRCLQTHRLATSPYATLFMSSYRMYR